jgi:hypothetical protein
MEMMTTIACVKREKPSFSSALNGQVIDLILKALGLVLRADGTGGLLLVDLDGNIASEISPEEMFPSPGTVTS